MPSAVQVVRSYYYYYNYYYCRNMPPTWTNQRGMEKEPVLLICHKVRWDRYFQASPLPTRFLFPSWPAPLILLTTVHSA
jgi:hypothetical protein